MRSPHASPDPSTWRDTAVDTRVVVRRRLAPDEARTAGKRWTDVIGVVVAVDDDGLVLRRDPARRSSPHADTEVRIPAAQIEVVKRLPPRPERRV